MIEIEKEKSYTIMSKTTFSSLNSVISTSYSWSKKYSMILFWVSNNFMLCCVCLYMYRIHVNDRWFWESGNRRDFYELNKNKNYLNSMKFNLFNEIYFQYLFFFDFCKFQKLFASKQYMNWLWLIRILCTDRKSF